MPDTTSAGVGLATAGAAVVAAAAVEDIAADAATVAVGRSGRGR